MWYFLSGLTTTTAPESNLISMSLNWAVRGNCWSIRTYDRVIISRKLSWKIQQYPFQCPLPRPVDDDVHDDDDGVDDDDDNDNDDDDDDHGHVKQRTQM